MPPQKIRVSFRSTIPTLILHKCIVTPQIHCHWLATERAMRNQFCRHTHTFLLLHHLTNGGFVIIGFLATRLVTLKQAIITLRIEQPMLIESRLLKLVINIGSQNNVILILDQSQQVLIHWFRGWRVAIYPDIAAPIYPVFLQRVKGIKTARVHVAEVVLFCKVVEMLFKAFSRINKPG